MPVEPKIVSLPPFVVTACREHAEAACIGGVSRFRGNDRMATLYEDQLTGQIGNAAGAIWLTGSILPYLSSRRAANSRPLVGDNGSDLPGYRVDFKTSRMRGSSDAARYNLLVRPREVHPRTVYVLVLVSAAVPAPDEWVDVFVVGWTTTEDLPVVSSEGKFAGAHVVPATSLRSVDAAAVREILTRSKETPHARAP